MTPQFTSPPDPAGFRARVWEVARRIPPGKVATYGQIASLIPMPDGLTAEDYRAYGARWVGGAMSSCPNDVPWQRVINSQGKISLPPARGGALQRGLLEAEGVVFDARDRINLQIYGWDPGLPPEAG
jgi:methylated-DNA-protein-cysteine methyltransferase-like protein